MKRIVSMITAIMLFSMAAFAQTYQITVPVVISLPDSIAGKEFVKNLVNQAVKDAGIVPTVPKPPVITLPGCEAGPEIKAIYDITSTSIGIQFHGQGVTKMLGEVFTESNVRVAYDTIEPQSAYVSMRIVYPLAPGTYILRISGVKCSGTDSKKFTVSASVGEITEPTKPDPSGPAIPAPEQATGFKQLQLTQGMDSHLKLNIVDGVGVKLYSDVSTEGRGADYSYRYIINGQILTQKDKLKDYPVAGNYPLRVLKFKIKDGLETINHWGTGAEEYGGYYKPDAGELFSYNTSFAFNTFVFAGPQTEAGFLNHIPQGYDPRGQQITWADLAQDMELPKGHVWIGDWTGWSTDLVYKKGVTHLPHHGLPWNDADGNKVVHALKNAGKTYNNVPRNEVIFSLQKRGENDYTGPNGINKAWWPNGPFDKKTSIEKADQADISDAIWIGETMENESWLPSGFEMWGHFYKRLHERYEDRFGKRGIPYQIVHNYYYLWPREISLARDRSADYYRKLLVTKAADLPKTDYSPGGTLSSTTMICEAIYLGAPDIQTGVLYESIFRFHINAILGYDSGIFLAGQHEYRPNNKYLFRYPEGEFYSDKKVPLDPNVHIAAGFISQVYGKLFIEWGASGKKSHKNQSYEWSKGLWFPHGATSPQGGFPYYSYTNDYYACFDGGADLSYFSQALYNKTFAQTDGGKRQYLSYQIDGGPWIKPDQASGQEIVSAYFDKRGFVYSQTKNGKTAWFYLNSYADNNWHTINVQLPSGKVVSQKVATNAIHAKLEF